MYYKIKIIFKKNKFDPLEADKIRRPKDPTVRIGLESRVQILKKYLIIFF